MLENLIKLGEALGTEVKQSMDTKFCESVNFEVWVSKSILYLENYQKGSLITEKVKARYRGIENINNYDFYQFLLGSLKAIRDFEYEEIPVIEL
ncbi:hypothetical protein BW897_20920 [Bacillus cereus]|uniref:Uncharacterized protein n=1 Tax=Bacillus cereus TaxID=1396 RepID=A0A1S9TLD1_BACCE|nr:hypothetical protein [Bacillus cereus]OOR10824.1 hypothetical protein BW897_20920 [Bacillus cereus]